MRTTVDLDEDTSRAVKQLREESGLGVSQAVNELIRRGLLPRPEAGPSGSAPARWVCASMSPTSPWPWRTSTA